MLEDNKFINSVLVNSTLHYDVANVEDWLWQRFNQAKENLEKLYNAGYNPIAYSVMICEDTFVFETNEEAEKAFAQFETNGTRGNIIQGWWYGKEEYFQKVYPKYVADMKEFDYVPQFILLKNVTF